jgi:isoquinoline 1-oxidoreductase subunit beta
MSLLGKHPRYQRILAMAADKAGWGKSGEGKAMGVAIMEGYGTYLAQISEVSVEGGKPRVHRVINVIDCGMMVNPAIVRGQVESSVMYGLTAAIKGEITVDKGRVQQTNFDSYPMLRMNEMPKVETYLVQSSEKPGGVGEPVVGLIPPSVANALHQLTGKRVRKLPILTVA